MDHKEIKISIDPNGNVHREIIDRAPSEEKKPRILKRLVATLPI